ncbi:MAG: UDP-3-O-(3-hydroxymyristoyl)glucosamine N-acyltransferase, partial [Alphaproteobacteria bacterium]|nr:UDP-3-O-(3-hydroxymyristoyl)glucosamine N-acyltransferase [Alphaproteobacteria bacterium]
MPDERFFCRSGPYTLEALSEMSGATLSNSSDKALEIEDVSPIDNAKSGEICFLDNRKYVEKLAICKASACILAESDAEKAPPGMALLISDDP